MQSRVIEPDFQCSPLLAFLPPLVQLKALYLLGRSESHNLYLWTGNSNLRPLFIREQGKAMCLSEPGAYSGAGVIKVITNFNCRGRVPAEVKTMCAMLSAMGNIRS